MELTEIQLQQIINKIEPIIRNIVRNELNSYTFLDCTNKITMPITSIKSSNIIYGENK